ncbi:hypothetical protein KBZ21_41110 [Streptomyces sp. A73]|nr:hypothetical protein [Streptomyces sp. A73]
MSRTLGVIAATIASAVFITGSQAAASASGVHTVRPATWRRIAAFAAAAETHRPQHTPVVVMGRV